MSPRSDDVGESGTPWRPAATATSPQRRIAIPTSRFAGNLLRSTKRMSRFVVTMDMPGLMTTACDNGATSLGDPRIYPGEGGHVRYAEGVFIGYRHHDRSGVAPMFPFGHGLSYTSFSLSDLAVAGEGEDVAVTVPLTNTGAREGFEVVLLYVSPAPAPVERPARELKAFAKVTLVPGESRRVELTLPRRAFAWYDPDRHVWVVEPGTYGITVGSPATGSDLQGAWTSLGGAKLQP